MHDHKSPTQDSYIPECTIMQTTTIMHIRNLPPGSRAPTGARSRHQTPCSHWSTLTSPEISHSGAVLPLEHAHVCACAAARTAEMCEYIYIKGLSNPTRKAHSLTQRRSAATSAGVWDSAVHSSHVPRPTQLKPRYAPPTTPPYLMSRAPAGSLTQTHTLRRRVAAVSHVLTMVPASLSSG